MRNKGFAFCLLFVTVLCASLLSAQTGGAMLSTINGDVQVNGHASGRSTSVFAGDRIEVPASTAGSINQPGSSVVVSPNSSIQYGTDNIQLLQGGARISTSQGMTASVGPIVVAPKDSSAKFDVIQRADHVVVVSREGALTVKDGERTMVVASGETTELPLPVSALQASAQNANQKAPDILSSTRISEHPFYGVVNGATSNSMFPACASTLECIRPSVSNIRPCCCPNSPPFCVNPPPQNPQQK